MYVGSNASETFVKESVNGKFDIGVAPYPAKYLMQQGTDLFIFNSVKSRFLNINNNSILNIGNITIF